MSFLIAPRTLEAKQFSKNVPITVPSSKTHSPILWDHRFTVGKQRRGTVDSPNEPRPGRETAGPIVLANRIEPSSETAPLTSVNGSSGRGQTRMLRSQSGTQLRAERARETTKVIAIIDDDDAMQDSLRDLMEAAGLVARCFGSAGEFLESGLHHQAACLITDILMPKMSGLQLQARLKDEECDIPIIFITAHGDAETRIQAMRGGAVEFLAKPFDHQLLLKTVRAALDM